MSTDSQNPRYSYLTLNRSIVGTDSFELNVAGSTIYRLDTNTSTVNVKLNNSGNDAIPLVSKRRIDVGSNGFTKIIVNWTGIAVAETLQLLIADSEASNTDIGVEIQDYSTSIAGGIAITGTVDVDIVGQTGQDPLHNDLVQIGGATAPVTDLTTILGATNPANTSFRGWTYLNTGTGILATNASGNPAYITAVSANAFGLTSTDNTIFLGLYDATPTLVANFIAFTFNHATPGGALEDGTFGYAMSFPTPIEVPNGFSVRLVGGANTWSSGSVWGLTT